MAAPGPTATSDFLAQFRPLFGPIAGIFLLTTAALAVAAWRRRPRLGVGALLAAMIAFLPLSVEGLTLFAKSRSVRVMTDAIQLRVGPADVIAHEGALENSASALLRLDRRVQIVNGRRSNLAFGSTFPEARPIFWDTAALARAWAGIRRVFLPAPAQPERGARATGRPHSSAGRAGPGSIPAGREHGGCYLAEKWNGRREPAPSGATGPLITGW
jgi:hypothetical protein